MYTAQSRCIRAWSHTVHASAAARAAAAAAARGALLRARFAAAHESLHQLHHAAQVSVRARGLVVVAERHTVAVEPEGAALLQRLRQQTSAWECGARLLQAAYTPEACHQVHVRGLASAMQVPNLCSPQRGECPPSVPTRMRMSCEGPHGPWPLAKWNHIPWHTAIAPRTWSSLGGCQGFQRGRMSCRSAMPPGC